MKVAVGFNGYPEGSVYQKESNEQEAAEYPVRIEQGEEVALEYPFLVDGDALENIAEAVTFTDGPAVPTDVMLGTWADVSTAPPFDVGDAGAYGEPGFGVVPFDFAYPTGLTSYTSSKAGQPLGEIHANDAAKLAQARSEVLAAITWSDEPVQPLPHFYGIVE